MRVRVYARCVNLPGSIHADRTRLKGQCPVPALQPHSAPGLVLFDARFFGQVAKMCREESWATVSQARMDGSETRQYPAFARGRSLCRLCYRACNAFSLATIVKIPHLQNRSTRGRDAIGLDIRAEASAKRPLQYRIGPRRFLLPANASPILLNT